VPQRKAKSWKLPEQGIMATTKRMTRKNASQNDTFFPIPRKNLPSESNHQLCLGSSAPAYDHPSATGLQWRRIFNSLIKKTIYKAFPKTFALEIRTMTVRKLHRTNAARTAPILVGLIYCVPMLPTLALAAPQADIYVAASGNPHSDGRTPATAVDTLARARDIARTLAAPRTVHIIGSLHLTEPLKLDTVDSGTSWIGASDAALLGSGRAPVAIYGSTLHDTVFQNFQISGFTQQGIKLVNPVRVTVTNLSIYHISATQWNQSGIDISGNISDVKILNNTVGDTNYNGISVFSDYNQTQIRVIISGNHVTDTCKTVADCGAIYLGGRGQDQGSHISNNTVINFGPATSKGRGIYLDELESNASVTGNCIEGPGLYAIHIHGGRMNTITGNHIDARQLSAALLNQATSNHPTQQMDGNHFSQNTVYLNSYKGKLVEERQTQANQVVNSDNNHVAAVVNSSNVCTN
jgi:hypothetical protein